MSLIELHTVDFSYDPVEPAKDSSVLKNITLSIDKGDFAVLLGRRGSGKSTFLKLLNALLIPTRGLTLQQDK
jgi:ABC-type bacteriocin/lantibiotic exporter with double-glycine peptidase domain